MKFYTALVFSGTIALLSLASCKSKKEEAKPATSPRDAVTRVNGYLVTPQAFADNIEVPGSVIANETTQIYPEISGRVIQLNVQEGRTVSKGTLLAKIYDADLQAQLQKLQVQLKIAQTNEERSSQLLRIEGISKADYDASLLNVNTIKADMQIVRTSIVRTEIRAPFNGTLGLKNISPGAYVTPQTIICEINQTSQLKLDFTVPEKYAAQMKPGKQVRFTYEGSNQLFNARITATQSAVTQSTRSLMVRSLVETRDAGLLPGSFAKVQLGFDPDPNAILVPSQAVLPQARGKKIILYKQGVASFVDVTTGIRDSARVQILEGIKAGDTIVISGLLSLRPNAKIRINKVYGGANADSTAAAKQ